MKIRFVGDMSLSGDFEGVFKTALISLIFNKLYCVIHRIKSVF
jgi:hypothetical protein